MSFLSSAQFNHTVKPLTPLPFCFLWQCSQCSWAFVFFFFFFFLSWWPLWTEAVCVTPVAKILVWLARAFVFGNKRKAQHKLFWVADYCSAVCGMHCDEVMYLWVCKINDCDMTMAKQCPLCFSNIRPIFTVALKVKTQQFIKHNISQARTRTLSYPFCNLECCVLTFRDTVSLPYSIWLMDKMIDNTSFNIKLKQETC